MGVQGAKPLAGGTGVLSRVGFLGGEGAPHPQKRLPALVGAYPCGRPGAEWGPLPMPFPEKTYP